jgi:hypothetical protein
MAHTGPPSSSTADWLNPPVLVEPQPRVLIARPVQKAPPLGIPMPANMPKNPPTTKAPLPMNAPTVKAPPPGFTDVADMWDHEEKADVPITITRTFEDGVKAAEKRITDTLNKRIGELTSCVKDIERHVVLLREEVALITPKDNYEEVPVTTTRDQGTDAADDPKPPVVDDCWTKQWNEGRHEPAEDPWPPVVDDYWTKKWNDSAGSTGGNEGDQASSSWQRDTRWDKTDWRAR